MTLNRKRNKTPEDRHTIIGVLFWTVLATGIFFKIFFTVQGLGKSSTISSLEKEAHLLRVENRKLQMEVVSKTSLSDLGKRAGELGFVDIKTPQHIRIEDLAQQALR